jgi:hypothetical protein
VNAAPTTEQGRAHSKIAATAVSKNCCYCLQPILFLTVYCMCSMQGSVTQWCACLYVLTSVHNAALEHCSCAPTITEIFYQQALQKPLRSRCSEVTHLSCMTDCKLRTSRCDRTNSNGTVDTSASSECRQCLQCYHYISRRSIALYGRCHDACDAQQHSTHSTKQTKELSCDESSAGSSACSVRLNNAAQCKDQLRQ